MRQLSAVTAFFDTAEGQPRIGADKVVDKTGSGFYFFRCESCSLFNIAGKDSGAEAESRIIALRDAHQSLFN